MWSTRLSSPARALLYSIGTVLLLVGGLHFTVVGAIIVTTFLGIPTYVIGRPFKRALDQLTLWQRIGVYTAIAAFLLLVVLIPIASHWGQLEGGMGGGMMSAEK